MHFLIVKNAYRTKRTLSPTFPPFVYDIGSRRINERLWPQSQLATIFDELTEKGPKERERVILSEKGSHLFTFFLRPIIEDAALSSKALCTAISLFKRLPFFTQWQCDQIWWNFATLAKFYMSLAIFLQFISYLPKCWPYFGKFGTLLG